MSIKQTLKAFCLCGAPAGEESTLYDEARKKLSVYGSCNTDIRGNFICTKEGSGKHFLLDAHMDQIGFAVTSIEENGFLKVAQVGGVDRRVLPSLEVEVLGKERLYGVIACKPPHLAEDKEKDKAPKPEDIAIDTGLCTEALKQKVSLGDRVVLKPYFAPLLGERVCGTALDDRAGMTILVRVMELLKKQGSKAKITAVFSVGEEVGGKGADNAAFAAEADEAIVIDVSFGAQPEIGGAHKYACMPLGGGAFIGAAPLLDKRMTQSLIACAEENGIPYQIEVMGGKTGTNADGIATAKYGVKTATVSPPVRNMHTGVEVADIGDLEHCAKLIAAYILREEEKECVI